ncbi:redoxin family protein [Rheinheimera sp.]|uniref:redoxin family protein n=1 Tax=Rheinheimera sp. TaxID=1869214 RepID=UPI003D272C34
MRKTVFYVPLAAFLLLSLFLLSGLFSDPRDHGSALLEKPLPAFSLPELQQPNRQISAADFRGEVTLLNVWGVWCPTCNAELGFLTTLRQQGVRIVGLYYVQPVDSAFGEKFDLPALQQQVRDKLAEQGDPYLFNVVDEQRSLIFDLGVTGAPETFVIDRQGVIRHHHVGDINPQNWPQLQRIYQQLQQGADYVPTP